MTPPANRPANPSPDDLPDGSPSPSPDDPSDGLLQDSPKNSATNASEPFASDELQTDNEPWISDEEIPAEPPRKHSAELFPIPPAAKPTSSPSDSNHSEQTPSGAGSPLSGSVSARTAASAVVGPLPLVETAFLASAASLMWLINSYFPPGPLLRILFPLPVALIYLRWNLRSAWMTAAVAGLLLTILLGPTRSIFFVMPYGLLGVQLGYFWRRRASWELSIVTGSLLVSLGTFFRIWLLSLLSGEDLWGYLVAQITQFLDWLVRLLTNWGWVGLGAWGQPSMELIAIAAIITVLFSNMVYMLTVHLAAWLVLERLGVAMPEPPDWVQALIEE